MTPRLVVEPGVPFDAIDRHLAALGWTRQPSTAVAPPIVPGEPEFASWKRDDQRASYSFNPVVRLRSLDFSGNSAGQAMFEVAAHVPALDLRAVRGLLAGPSVRELLLGIFAARELGAVLALDAVVALRDHADATVSSAADRAATDLTKQLIDDGAARLVAESARRPGHSVFFPRLGAAYQRRQVLRWMLADHPRPDEPVLAVLRTALDDSDWEVRAGAIIAAGRLNAQELWPDVRRTDLPEITRNGPDRVDQSVLRGIRRMVLDRLQHGAAHVESDAQEQLRRCIAGEAPLAHDRIFLLVHALTTPHEPGHPPSQLPAGVIAASDGYELEHMNLPLCWIDAVPHWLGSADPGESPPRRVTPARGFLISREAGAAESWHDAGARARDLAQAAGVAARLPTADEWEFAARGTDGRRFPWGNGYEADPIALSSPWGLRGLCAGDGEWVTGADQPACCGDRHDPRAAVRRVADVNTPLGIRFVVSVG